MSNGEPRVGSEDERRECQTTAQTRQDRRFTLRVQSADVSNFFVGRVGSKVVTEVGERDGARPVRGRSQAPVNGWGERERWKKRT